MINYYKELGINKNADLQEIKSAYLKQLKKYHPDVYDGDEIFAQEKTAILNECYNTLKDDKLRSEYDKKLFGTPVTNQTTTSSNSANQTTTKKTKRENIFKEFTKYFKVNINLNTYNNHKQEKPVQNKQKVKKEKIKKQPKSPEIKTEKSSKFITENDIAKKERMERIKLSGSIILVSLIIIVVLLLILII